MGAEKQIVKYWLNKKGFYTIDNIKAGKKAVDFIAIGFEKGKIKQIKHVDVACSISSTAISVSKLKDSINKHIKTKFSEADVVKKVNNVLKEFAGTERKYENIFVLSMLPDSNKKNIIDSFKNKGIKIYEFEDILLDVMVGMDTHYYKDDTVRTLQLVKYLLLAKPYKLAKLIEEKDTTILKRTAKDKFLISLLKDKKIRKALGKADEKEIASLIKHSSLSKPSRLAQLIAEDVLGKRSKGKFLRALMEQETMKRFFKFRKKEKKEEKIKKEKPLVSFFD